MSTFAEVLHGLSECMLILLIVSVMQYGVECQPGGPTVLLRGHPDEILSHEEVHRYWKRPTRHVLREL